MKGLPRSLSRGSTATKGVFPVNIAFNKVIAMTDPGAAAAWGTAPLYPLPQGNLLILGLVCYTKFTKGGAPIIDTFDGDFSLGSAPSVSNIALATDKADLVATTAFPTPATAGVTALFRTASAGALAGLILDNTAASLEVNLNVLLDDAAISGAANLRVEGTLSMLLGVLGDD